MYLFIDTISPNSTMILFENNRILSQTDFVIKWKEYDNFLQILNDFLSSQNVLIDDIKWIVLVNWPGWFTWTRIVTLTINTILFTLNVPISGLNYFQLLEMNWLSYPMLIKANRWEYLIKNNSSDEPFLIDIDSVPTSRYSGIWDILDFENRDIYIEWIKDYKYFIENNQFSFSDKRIEPYYIKKPSIS